MVLVGGAASFTIGDKPNLALAVICILVAAAFLGAIWLAVQSARPSDFDFVGSSPSDWLEDVEADVPMVGSLAEQCANEAEAIVANHNRMKKNGKLLQRAIDIALGALVIGGLSLVLALVLV